MTINTIDESQRNPLVGILILKVRVPAAPPWRAGGVLPGWAWRARLCPAAAQQACAVCG